MKTVDLTVSLDTKEQEHFDELMTGVARILDIKPKKESGMIIQHAKGVYTDAKWQPVYNAITFSDGKLHVSFALSEKRDVAVRKFLFLYTKQNNIPFNKKR